MKHVPLSQASYYILATLAESPLHGYAIMKKIDTLSEKSIVVSSGTLYGALSTMTKQGLTSMIGDDGRRRCYGLTAIGRAVLIEQIKRFEGMLHAANSSYRHSQSVGAIHVRS